jgi:hypothetical protein
MVYKKLKKVDTYQSLAIQSQGNFILVKKQTPLFGVVPNKFECFLLEDQRHLKNYKKHITYVTCKFNWGTGFVKMNDNVIGIITKKKGKYQFIVDGQQIMELTILKGGNDTLLKYKLTYNGSEFYMTYPNTNKGLYILRYKFIKTKCLGQNSTKNFALNSQEEKRVLECLKIDPFNLMLSCEAPLTQILSAVVGIMRYRCRKE